MTNWLIKVNDKAIRSLAKIDRKQAARIWHFLEVELPATTNPRATGKALQADLKGFWRYRIGDYRLICQIKDSEIVILVLDVDHRKDIYR